MTAVALLGYTQQYLSRNGGIVVSGRVLAARLSGQGIATAIKRAGEAAGLDPDTLGGHSLRAGFVTEAARRGETAFRIMATTRHRSTESLKGYIRPTADGGRGAIGLL